MNTQVHTNTVNGLLKSTGPLYLFYYLLEWFLPALFRLWVRCGQWETIPLLQVHHLETRGLRDFGHRSWSIDISILLSPFLLRVWQSFAVLWQTCATQSRDRKTWWKRWDYIVCGRKAKRKAWRTEDKKAPLLGVWSEVQQYPTTTVVPSRSPQILIQ